MASVPASVVESLRTVRRHGWRIILLGATLALGSGAAACGARPTNPSDDSGPQRPVPGTQRFEFAFRSGDQGWTGAFAEYSTLTDIDSMMLEWDHRPLPDVLGGGSALFMQSANRSEDVFMFLKREVGGLDASKTYAVAFEVEIATDVPYGCPGFGGSPGEGVYVKAGASAVEPRVVILDGWYEVTLDKGNQSRSGREAVTLGNIATSRYCDDAYRHGYWERKTLHSGPGAVVVKPDASGSIWLVAGTDSGSGGVTRLYYTRFVAELTPVE